MFDTGDKEATMHSQQTPRHRTRRLAVSIFLAAVTAAVAVQAAAAMLGSTAVTGGGEAKNQAPFTRVASASSDKSDVVSRYLASHGITGQLAAEPKNELPFTRAASPAVSDRSDVISRYLTSHGSALQASNAKAQAEARNEQFVTPQVGAASEDTSATTSSSSFNWTLLAAIAGILATMGAGAAAAMHVRHRAPRTA
jgi:hypothetical protein